MALYTPIRLAAGEHVVQFYDDDAELAAAVGGYLSVGLVAGDDAVVIATADHVAAFERVVAEIGVDGDTGRLTTVDASETLNRFMIHDHPEPHRFDEVVGGLVHELTRGGRALHAYGEMVALLWEQGNVAAAIELEDLWNDLGTRLPFGLLCAYPTHLVGVGQDDAVTRVCHAHTNVVRRSDCDGRTSSRAFAYSNLAPREARRFVRTTLQLWGAHADDVELVTGELTSNAILHAETDFTVTVTDRSDAVRIAVTDRSPIPPTRRVLDPSSPSGRGIAMIAILARAWGCDPTADGKTVWADIALIRP